MHLDHQLHHSQEARLMQVLLSCLGQDDVSDRLDSRTHFRCLKPDLAVLAFKTKTWPPSLILRGQSGECVPHWKRLQAPRKSMLYHSYIGRARMKTRRTTRDTREALVFGNLILRSSWGKEGTGQFVRNVRYNLYHYKLTLATFLITTRTTTALGYNFI